MTKVLKHIFFYYIQFTCPECGLPVPGASKENKTRVFFHSENETKNDKE